MISDMSICSLPESPVFFTTKQASDEEDEYGEFENSYRSDYLALLADFTKLALSLSNKNYSEDYSSQWFDSPSKWVSPQLATYAKQLHRTGKHYHQKCPVVTCHYHTEGMPPSISLLKHLQRCHNNVELYDKPYKCPITRCEYSTIGFQRLELSINHIETQHQVIPPNLVSEYFPEDLEALDSGDEMLDLPTPLWNEGFSTSPERLNIQPEINGELDDDYDLALEFATPVADEFHRMEDMRGKISDVVGQDLELIEFLLPMFQAYGSIQCSPGSTDCGSSSTSQSTARTEALNSSTCSYPLVHSNSSNKKRGRPDDEPPDDGRSNDSKRPRSGCSQSGYGSKKKAFACPFYKKLPQNYCTKPDGCRKYRTCMGPGYSVLRRMKDHLDAVHRTFQCERCYTIFSGVDELSAHRRSEPPCDLQSADLKEGIDEGQWSKIDALLRTKRGKACTKGNEIDIQKWFGVWRILFRNSKEPDHPFYDEVSAAPQFLTPDTEMIISSVDTIARLDAERGNFQFDEQMHERYRYYISQSLELQRIVTPHNSPAVFAAANFEQTAPKPHGRISDDFPPEVNGCPSLSDGHTFDSERVGSEVLAPVQEVATIQPGQPIYGGREVIHHQEYCNTNMGLPSIAKPSDPYPRIVEWHQDFEENLFSQNFEKDSFNSNVQDPSYWNIADVDLGPFTGDRFDDNTITTWLDAEVKATNPTNYSL